MPFPRDPPVFFFSSGVRPREICRHPGQQFVPNFYCGGGYEPAYCVALGRTPRRNVNYASGALRSRALDCRQDGGMPRRPWMAGSGPLPSPPPRYEPLREMRARSLPGNPSAFGCSYTPNAKSDIFTSISSHPKKSGSISYRLMVPL
jgi:hypothetical protein